MPIILERLTRAVDQDVQDIIISSILARARVAMRHVGLLMAVCCGPEQAGLQQASQDEQAFRAAYRSKLSARLSPARDSDGFRKLLLVCCLLTHYGSTINWLIDHGFPMQEELLVCVSIHIMDTLQSINKKCTGITQVLDCIPMHQGQAGGCDALSFLSLVPYPVCQPDRC